jgi:hypothetical protein
MVCTKNITMSSILVALSVILFIVAGPASQSPVGGDGKSAQRHALDLQSHQARHCDFDLNQSLFDGPQNTAVTAMSSSDLADWSGSPFDELHGHSYLDTRRQHPVGEEQRCSYVDASPSLESVRDLVARRPDQSDLCGLFKWNQEFDNHPDVKGLDFSKSPKDLELDVRELRGSETDPVAHRHFSNALKRLLRLRGVSSHYSDMVLHHWSLYLDSLRKKRLHRSKMDTITEEEMKEIRDSRKKASRANYLRKKEAKGGVDPTDEDVKLIVQDLLDADIASDLSVEMMEARTRPILNRHPDAKTSRRALYLYLMQRCSKEYVEEVMLLSRSITYKQSKQRRDKRRKEKNKLSRGAAAIQEHGPLERGKAVQHGNGKSTSSSGEDSFNHDHTFESGSSADYVGTKTLSLFPM